MFALPETVSVPRETIPFDQRWRLVPPTRSCLIRRGWLGTVTTPAAITTGLSELAESTRT